jgi:hypothetical protein
MKMTWLAMVAAGLVAGGAALGQQTHSHQPYRGLQEREIKALSPEQIADLRAGRGLGFALAAELNGYPGPLHVIELAERLGLSAAQRAAMQRFFEQMKAETVALGERLIEEERALDRLFADRKVTPESLQAVTQRIGTLQAQLRAAHLKYHLEAAGILTADQSRHYAELRGYRADAPAHQHRKH